MGLYLKPVSGEDCDLLFEWVNDNEVRSNAFNSSKVKYEEHNKWFNEKLNSQNTFIYILYNDAVPIGQIRIDICEGTGIIDYSIARKYRGLGYGTDLIRILEEQIFIDKINISQLVGKVKATNMPSRRAFKKAGYREYLSEDYVSYIKTLD